MIKVTFNKNIKAAFMFWNNKELRVRDALFNAGDDIPDIELIEVYDDGWCVFHWPADENSTCDCLTDVKRDDFDFTMLGCDVENKGNKKLYTTTKVAIIL